MSTRARTLAFIAGFFTASVVSGPAAAKSVAKGKAMNPLPRTAGARICQNTSYPGFRGAEKTHRWTTTPQCHVFAKGKHLVCENASGGVSYVESSTWNPQARIVTTRFFISQPYKNYDVTSYRWDKNTDISRFVSEIKDKGIITRASRVYHADGSTHFRYTSVERNEERLLLEIKCRAASTP